MIQWKGRSKIPQNFHVNLHWIYTFADYGRIADLLIRSGAEVNIGDRNGATPLHVAARGIVQIKVFFLTVSSHQNNSYFQFLHNLTDERKENLVNLLIKHYANVNQPDINGQLPLHLAAENGTKKKWKKEFELLLFCNNQTNSYNWIRTRQWRNCRYSYRKWRESGSSRREWLDSTSRS